MAKRIIRRVKMTLRASQAETIRQKIEANPHLNFKFEEGETKRGLTTFVVKYDSSKNELFRELIFLLTYNLD